MSEGSGVRQRKGVEEVKQTPASSKDEKYVPWEKRLKRKPPTCCQIIIRICLWSTLVLIVAGVVFGVYIINLESAIEPVSYSLPPHRPLEGPLEPNTILQKAKRLFEGKMIGPESLAICDGKMYTGTYDGRVVRIDSDTSFTTIARFGKEPCGKKEYEHTCGRPLGMKASGHGTLYVMDAYLGLHEVNCKTGKYSLIIPNSRTYNSKPVMFGNDVERITNGDIFFTDSDFKWQRRDFPYIMAESAPNGRLMWYNPVTKFSSIAVEKFHFANGIQLSPNQDFLLICETTRNRIIKYHLQGDQAGDYEIFIDSLPGMPDNISPSEGGGYWIGLAFSMSRSYFGIFDFLSSKTWFRDQVVKVFSPEYLLKRIPKYGMIIELSQEGEIINSLHDPTGEVVGGVSEVLDTGEALYLGSYHAPYLLKLDYKSEKRTTFKK